MISTGEKKNSVQKSYHIRAVLYNFITNYCYLLISSSILVSYKNSTYVFFPMVMDKGKGQEKKGGGGRKGKESRWERKGRGGRVDPGEGTTQGLIENEVWKGGRRRGSIRKLCREGFLFLPCNN